MIEQYAESPLPRWVERGDGVDEVVGAVQRLDDDAAVAELVAPHQLDQLGVVSTFDPDPARRGDPGAGPGGGNRTRRRDRQGTTDASRRAAGGAA